MVKKVILFILSVLLFTACKTQKSVGESTANTTLSAAKVIKAHNAQEHNFETLSIRANAKYDDAKQAMGAAVDIRIQKDQLIWVSIKKLGITFARAKITPKNVSYYEVIDGTFFDGSYDVISNWLGTDLDFQKLQNLFIGKVLDDLTKEKYTASIVDGLYKLAKKNKHNTIKEFYFEGANFLVKKEFISQPKENRSLQLNYPSFTNHEKMYLPNEIFIEAQQKKKVKIEIEYKNAIFNEKLNTPFSIPNGYEQVQLK